eukprot:4463093-Karenia_brevis.AAC.1
MRPVASPAKKPRVALSIPDSAVVKTRPGRAEVLHADDVPQKFWAVLQKLGRASKYFVDYCDLDAAGAELFKRHWTAPYTSW